MKLSFRAFILLIVICAMVIPGAFATWKYSYTDDIEDKNASVGVSINTFNYFDEVVITKLTLISSTTNSQSSSYIQPTNVQSTITGHSGQIVVYKVNARNYSKTTSFVYAGVDYKSGTNKVSVSASLDEQGTNLINNNISSNGKFLEVALMQKQYIPFQILTLF